MSVKELNLTTAQDIKVKVKFDGREFEFEFDIDRSYVWLDRSQAHLLMLYLQEHLK